MTYLPEPSWIASVLQAMDAHPFAALGLVVMTSMTVIGVLTVYALRKR